MNILRFELKSLLRSFLVWTASLIALYLLLMLGFYGMFMEGKDAVMSALKDLPPYFAAIFGIQLDKIFSFGGFFQFVFTYIGVVGAIMAASVSLHAFAREKRLKCADFILTKPVGRGKIFLMKLFACLAVLAAANILFLAACALSWQVNGAEESLGTVLLAALSLFFTQLVFLAIGALISMLLKKVRSVSGVAMVIGLTGFLLMMLSSLLKEEFMRYLSPLHYFNPGAVFMTGGYDAKLVWTGALIAVACASAAYVLFVRRDAHAV
jgi:ABC-2 type transport system permease protein